MVEERCTSSGRSDLSVIHEFAYLMSAQHLVSAAPGSKVRKMAAHSAEWHPLCTILYSDFPERSFWALVMLLCCQDTEIEGLCKDKEERIR
jgi:hypothetical protein